MSSISPYRLQSSLFIRFLLLLLLVVVPIFAITGIFNYLDASNRLKVEVKQEQQTWVVSRSDVLVSQLVAEGERLEDFALDSRVQDGLTGVASADTVMTTNAQLWQQQGTDSQMHYYYVNNSVGSALTDYIDRFHNRSFVVLADRSGALLGTTTRFWPEFNLSKFDWWPKLDSSQGIIVTQPQNVPNVGNNLILIIHYFPLRTDLSQPAGVLVVGLDFNQIMNSLFNPPETNQRLPDNQSAWVVYDKVATNGTPGDSNNGLVLSSVHSNVTRLPSDWLNDFAGTTSGSRETSIDENGQSKDFLFAYTQLERLAGYSQNNATVVFAVNQLNWVLIRGAPQSVAYAGLEGQLTTLAAGSVLLLIAVIIVVVVLSRLLLLRPIRNIDQAISAVAAGDLSVQVRSRGSDELSLLAQKFNTMVQSLDRLTRERDQRQQEQQQVSRQLQGSASELQSNAVQQNSFIAQQASTLAQIAATFKQLTNASSYIAQNSQRVAAAASSLQHEQQQGNLALHQTREVLGRLRADSESLEALAQSLAQGSTAISDVIREINDIADETKLLAFNAAIEASVGGVVGQRFSVIADEVRALADQSNAAAESAQQSLTEVQSYIGEVVTATQRELEAIGEGVRQSTRLDLLMQAITDAINALEDSVGVIEQGATQQRDGSATATNAIDNLAHASQQLVTQSSSVANAATQLRALADRLQTQV